MGSSPPFFEFIVLITLFLGVLAVIFMVSDGWRRSTGGGDGGGSTGDDGGGDGGGD